VLAGGLELAISCDIRISADDALFGCPEVRWNLLHGFGATRLPHTVGLSNAVTGQWYLLLGGSIGLVVGFRKWKSSSWGRPQWDALRLKIPFKIGDTVQKIALARWSRTFAALYSAGVPIMQAIEITGQTAGNAVLEKAMGDVIESVKSGGSIADPLKDAPIFPPICLPKP